MEILIVLAVLVFAAVFISSSNGKLATAIRNSFRGASDKAGAAISDPVRDGKYALEDAKKEVADFRVQIKNLIAANNILQAQLDTEESNVKKFENIAVKAGAADDEAGVREALTLKGKSEARLGALSLQVNKNEALEGQLRDQLQTLEDRISSGELNHVTLAAQLEGAKLREKAAKSAANAGSGRGLEALDNLEKAVLEQNASAEAWQELSDISSTGRAKSLEDKYAGKAGVSMDDVNKYLANKPA